MLTHIDIAKGLRCFSPLSALPSDTTMNLTTFWRRVASLVAVVVALVGCRFDGKPRTGLSTISPLWEKEISLYSVQSSSMGDLVIMNGSNRDETIEFSVLDAKTGELWWEQRSPDVGTRSYIIGGTQEYLIVVWEDLDILHFRGVHRTTGERLWEQQTPTNPDYSFNHLVYRGEQLIFQNGYTSFVVFDSTTGTEQWRVTIDRPYSFDESRPAGVHTIKSFTDIADGKTHYLTSDGMWGTIDFVAQTTNEVPITFVKPADLLLGERNIILYDLSAQTMAFNMGNTLIGIDRATLTEIWRVSGFLTNRIRHSQDGRFFISPYRAYDERTGEVVWERPGEQNANGLAEVQYVESTATILDVLRDGLGVRGISMATGEELWTVTLPDVAPTSRYRELAAGENIFVVGAVECGEPNLDPCPEVESSVFAYDLTTQALLWRYTAQDVIFVGMDGGVVVINADGKKVGVGVP